MKNNSNSNELFKTAHIVILECYTIFSLVLSGEALLLNWEKWTIILIESGLILAWMLHFRKSLSEKIRLYLYSILMMGTFFFYGIHRTSTYDLAPVMLAVIMIYTMTGVSALIHLCIATYFVTMGYELFSMTLAGETFDSLTVTRTMLHFAMILMAGWVSVTIISKWEQVMKKNDAEIEYLEDSSRRMTDFMANVSHEIRTPINAVIGLSSILKKEKLSGQVKNNVESISKAGYRVMNQVDDILDFSEIDMGRLSTVHENYMITSLIHDLILKLNYTEDYDLDLVVDVDPLVPAELKGDENKIKKILWHLILNGYKYSKEGGVYVRISAAKRDYGINLIMEVLDTGSGMTEDEIEHAYEKFYQSDSGRSRSEGGLGLGIPIVSGFVNSMGGVMSIKSTPGEGTHVTVSLPQEIADPDPCLEAEEKEKISVAGFLSFMTTENLKIRESYMEMISRLSKGLSVPFHRVESIKELKRLLETQEITHVFIGTGEFLENREYIEELSHKMNVALVSDRGFDYVPEKSITVLPKPFHGVQIVRFLNHNFRQDETIITHRMICQGVTALIVDDEPMNLMVGREIFSSYGIQVETANGGHDAVSICSAKKYDLIFMDHMMPGMDGIEAMKLIKNRYRSSDTEVCFIALTANATSSAKELFLNEGFDAFLSKPIDIAELERVLKRVLPRNSIIYQDLPVQEENRGREDKDKEDTGIKNAGSKEKAAAGEDTGDDFYNRLEEHGIDTASGLKYCLNDHNFYRQVLLSYAEDHDLKTRELNGFYEADNWSDYAVKIHSVKSSSKMIGALNISENARILEENAKAGNGPEIKKHHPGFMEEYTALMENIVDVLMDGFMTENDTEDEVLEFMPVNNSGSDVSKERSMV